MRVIFGVLVTVTLLLCLSLVAMAMYWQSGAWPPSIALRSVHAAIVPVSLFLATADAGLLSYSVYRVIRRRGRARRGLCARCGYDLRGSLASREDVSCPECGQRCGVTDGMDQFRRQLALYAIVTALLPCLIAIGFYPKLVTGDYCVITITGLQIGPHGYTTIDVSGEESYGTSVLSRAKIGGTRQKRGGWAWQGGFPAWPAQYSETMVFFPGNGFEVTANEDQVRQRLRVQAGATYVVRPRTPLTLYEFKWSNGRTRTGSIDVRPLSSVEH